MLCKDVGSVTGSRLTRVSLFSLACSGPLLVLALSPSLARVRPILILSSAFMIPCTTPAGCIVQVKAMSSMRPATSALLAEVRAQIACPIVCISTRYMLTREQAARIPFPSSARALSVTQNNSHTVRALFLSLTRTPARTHKHCLA